MYYFLFSRSMQKHKASALLAVVLVMALLSAMLSVSIAKMNAVSMNSADSIKTSNEAQSLAHNEESLIRATNYGDLQAKPRVAVSNTAFEQEVVLSKESNYSSAIKKRTATINVYKGNETIPRASVEVVRYSSEKETSGVPVGTVIAWPGANPPTTNGTWLECNGQSCAAYPALVAVLGKNTVPDYRDRFLESAAVAGNVKAAGLPNITGKMGSDDHDRGSDTCEPITSADNRANFTGSFKLGTIYSFREGAADLSGSSSGRPNAAPDFIYFDASLSNPIYGNSTTVQPASVTVRRFIKAA